MDVAREEASELQDKEIQGVALPPCKEAKELEQSYQNRIVVMLFLA